MDGHTRTVPAIAGDLFEKYLLPKAALAVILVASLAGTYLSVRLTGIAGLGVVVAKWAYLVALGVLTGGLVWKHAFVRPGDVTEAAGYCRAMFDRFDRIALGAVGVLAVTAPVVVAHYLAGGMGPNVGILGGVVASLAWLTVLVVHGGAGVERQYRGPIGLATTALAVAGIALTATAEVALVGRGPVAAGVRVLHLLAFALWVGGAVWNVFVAVPSGQATPTTRVVRAAGQQLERFRWAVRAIIPTLLLTGLYQAVDALGTDPGVYAETYLGWVVVGKLGLIVVLVGIFLICPMWRACSPIDGVCDLADLGDDRRGEGASADD